MSIKAFSQAISSIPKQYNEDYSTLFENREQAKAYRLVKNIVITIKIVTSIFIFCTVRQALLSSGFFSVCFSVIELGVAYDILVTADNFYRAKLGSPYKQFKRALGSSIRAAYFGFLGNRSLEFMEQETLGNMFFENCIGESFYKRNIIPFIVRTFGETE